jgi:hypothetical protein
LVELGFKEMRSSNPKYDKTGGVFLGLSTPWRDLIIF